MFVHYRTQGLVLKKENRGEADQLFTIYTKDFGRLEILGKAIRKISSKLRAGIDIFSLSEIEFIQGKTHRTLTDAIPIRKFENLKKDLNKLKIAYKISEVLNDLIKRPEPDLKIWRLINEVFQKLNNCPAFVIECSLIYYYFFWNLTSFLGYQPDLYHCALCQKKLRLERLYFNKKENGIICSDCFGRFKAGIEITPETIKILRIILKQNWPTLLKLKIEAQYLKELSLISKCYLLSICPVVQPTGRNKN